MLLVADLLLALAAFGLLSIAVSRTGPEGPVGIHLVTLPLALLLAAAVAIAFHGGHCAAWSPPGWLFYGGLIGHVVTMTLLPVVAISGRRARVFRAALIAALLGAALLVNAPLLAPQLSGPAGTALVGLTALGGWSLLGGLFVAHQRSAARAATARHEQLDAFELQRREFDRGEFAKLPEDAALWQLIQFTHSPEPEVQARCRARIAALPDLEGATRALLGTDWAPHALAYIDDAYPLDHTALAPEFAQFLDRELRSWRTQLIADHAGTWGANLGRHFRVAKRIQERGGDLRPALRRWLELLEQCRGHRDLAAFVRGLL